MKLGRTRRCARLRSPATRVSRERGVNDARNVSGINAARMETQLITISSSSSSSSKRRLLVRSGSRFDRFEFPSWITERERERDSITVSTGIPYREIDARDRKRNGTCRGEPHDAKIERPCGKHNFRTDGPANSVSAGRAKLNPTRSS